MINAMQQKSLRNLIKVSGIFLLLAALAVIVWQALAAPPVVSSVTPNNGPSTGGTGVFITGSGFSAYTPKTPNNYSFSGACQTYTAPRSTLYQLDVWGAQGGTAGTFVGGRGGYSTGMVFLDAGTAVNACVGGQGTEATTRTTTTAWPGGFNGGGGALRASNGKGKETASGGGGTDVRVGMNSLYSRVIVAGGGGGGSGDNVSVGNNNGSVGGAGGGLSGLDAPAGPSPAKGGTQTAGGANGPLHCVDSGTFGSASKICEADLLNTDKSGGGGGWFGGGGGAGTGGGSGFVFRPTSDVSSGIIGGTYFLGEDYYLSNVNTIDGGPSTTMPAPGGGTQPGQSGNGYSRITEIPYSVKIGGKICLDVKVVNNTQITCSTLPHSAGPVDVVVTIEGQSTTLPNGYTYTDKLSFSGPDRFTSGMENATYTIGLDYPYTGIVTLDDGGKGGTWSGASIINGNQIQFNNSMSVQVIYTPKADVAGKITLTADSGVSYVTNATKVIYKAASVYELTCFNQSTGIQTQNPFVIPGSLLNCQIVLNGPYDGAVSITDLLADRSGTVLGGVFASADSRFNNATNTFTTTFDNSLETTDQILSFSYTSPTWAQLMGEDPGYTGVTYDGSNGYAIFWPVLTASSAPVLTSTNDSVSVGLLAQSYDIFSQDTPAIDSAIGFGCIGCTSVFGISTYNAPYFGSIELTSDDPAGVFSYGSSSGSTVTVVFNGSGNIEHFLFTPHTVSALTTITGNSSGPTIANDSIAFEVRNSHIFIVCDKEYLARGESTNCTLSIELTDSTVLPGADTIYIEMQDIALGPAHSMGGGVITDTTNDGSWDNINKIYSFCFDENSLSGACIGASYERTFIYTSDINLDASIPRIRIQGASEEFIPAETSWALVNIISDAMRIYCPALYPNCDTGRVGTVQSYAIKPDGVFSGKVELTDGEGGLFSDDSVASWNYNGDEFIFEYTPTSTGIKTITATVTEVDNSIPTGIKVGDIYTFEVTVLANEITIFGPPLVALDDPWIQPRFGAVLNGPYEGSIDFYLWDSSTNTIITDMILWDGPGSNLISNSDGTYSCNVTIKDNYDAINNTTLACRTDNNGEPFANYNWFEIRAASQFDDYIADAIKVVGIIADNYQVFHQGSDATLAPIIGTVGNPLSFQLTPNALFEGVYSANSNGAPGFFLPQNTVVVTQDEWPATNDQTMQTKDINYVPTQPGIYELTFNATRDVNTAVPAGQENLGDKNVDLIILANEMTITGPDAIVRGQTYEYTLTLNGPYIGSVSIGDSLPTADSDFSASELSKSTCDFTLDDYIDGVSTCSFELTVTDSILYVNNFELFASFSSTDEVGTMMPISVLASDFSLVPGPVLENQRVNSPIEFTITPNAQFQGDFAISIISDHTTGYGQPCPTASEFLADFNPDTVPYLYSDYATVLQNPVSKTFTVTAHNFGHVCVIVYPVLGDEAPYSQVDVTIPPQILEIHIYDDLMIGGPSSITTGSVDNEFFITYPGEFSGTINFWVVDPATCNSMDPYDCGAPIPGAVINGNGISQDVNGIGECSLLPADVDPITNTTLCAFKLTIPDTYIGNYARILAQDSEGNWDYYDINLLANDFTVSPTIITNAQLDTPLDILITPINGLYSGTFTLSDGGAGGAFSPASVVFSGDDWPTDQTPMSGKTFSYSPAKYGRTVITVESPLGTKTVEIIVLADAMTVSGPNYIRRDIPGTYTLTIHGPYVGTINFSVIDQSTGLAIPGLTMSSTSCTVDTSPAYYDEASNTTTCTFDVTVPASAESTNFIEVIATSAPGDKALASTNKVTAVSASGYTLTPDTDQVVSVGTTIPFSITVNGGVLIDVFHLGISGDSVLSANAIAFTESDFLSGFTGVSKSFTVTTTKPGVETLDVTDPFGGHTTLKIYTLADDMSVTGPSQIQKGTTSGTFTLLLNGPYVGTADIELYLPDGGSGSPATGATLSTSSCTFTLSSPLQCTFTVDVAGSFDANWLAAKVSVPGIGEETLIIAITANAFDLTSDYVDPIGIAKSDVVTFTITPNQLFDGTFTLSDGGMGGKFVPTSIIFSKDNWPKDTLDQTLPSGLSFTYKPTKTGNITISVCNSTLGCMEQTIVAFSDGGPIEPPKPPKPPTPPDSGIFGVDSSIVMAISSGLFVISLLVGIPILRKLYNKK